jgi:putative peptidoglycan lipid II flippase
LYYADRVAQLPLGIIGIALGTALLPRLSAAEAIGQTGKVKEALSDALMLGGFFVIPAVVGLILIGVEIMQGLFVYGAFQQSDALMAAMALTAYGCGLPGFVIVKILQTAFYAAGQPGYVLKISILTVTVNVLGSLSLMPMFGHFGLALATAISGTVAALSMLYLLARQQRLSASFLPAIAKTVLASIIMGAAILIIRSGIGAFDTMPAALGLMIIVSASVTVYGVAVVILGAIPPVLLRRYKD